MKIRNGFVSNSSSSSFIIKFDKNIDLKTQINNMLNKVIDVSDLEYDISFYSPNSFDVNDYINIDDYYDALIKEYKNIIIDDLYESLSTPMNIESIKEDIETAKHIDKITFKNNNLFNNEILLKYCWNSGEYVFKDKLAEHIIKDNDNNYYVLRVSDHFKEYNDYDGILESWLQCDNEYVVDYNNEH